MAAGQQTASGAQPPATLDALIPESALENPEDWAAQGTASSDEVEAPELQEPVLDPVFEENGPFDIDEALDEGDVDVPEELAVDPDRPSFADFDAPTLIDLPDLIEVEVSDELILAFPADNALFPEQDQFITRFSALSAIENLDSGDITVPQLAARARSDEELLDDVLRTYGYYDGEVIRQLSGGRRGLADETGQGAEGSVDQDPKVRFDVLPGERYSFGAINLGEFDELPQEERAPLLEAFGIQPGDPLYADDIVSGARTLRVALGENGYPFGELSEPQLLIDHSREEGDLSLDVEPGGKFTFGAVTSDDPRFLSGRHLSRIARFEPGDLYKTSLQADLRRAILATGLVSSVVITPREVTPPEGDDLGEVALDVDIERAPLRTISGAVGYGTEDGIKVEAAWEHRNLFPPEGALRLRGILGTREQLASVTFRRNNFRGRDQVLTLDAFASDIETEAVDARTIAFRGAYERVSNLLFQKPLSWQLGGEVLYTDERTRTGNRDVFSPRQEYLIGSVFGSATIDASDDLLDPSSGFRVTGFAAPEVSRSLGQEAYYLRARVDGSYYQSVGNTVLAGRVAVASIVGADAFEIAPSRRLYSGGGGSVRGYGFQAIGPRNEFGEALGGGSLAEFALEARIQTGLLNGAVEVVPFVDAGTISRRARPDFEVFRIGAGIGARYKTSFGPIRVDVGVPVNPGEFDAPVVVYVSLGQAF
ncbi:BamA/TamA family outer membrane protein [Erythrobacter sp. SCSIO 43205]|uniref:autotransporter assembly complex protein TamA n=1 Tax=Erythrobacter sp. SCSIO 43205 TaxID=2779361 RepID=UPI001CA93390|nr:BamA/TamA family outer membrane protein [Erythrobacter sp. SCSIO 43205]UAB79136.1 BamA/TamA family outer membrane protein [Erythrobacter sp. SCSIO 43205]